MNVFFRELMTTKFTSIRYSTCFDDEAKLLKAPPRRLWVLPPHNHNEHGSAVLLLPSVGFDKLLSSSGRRLLLQKQ